MSIWSCRRCAVEYPDTDQPPRVCPICTDEREAVEPPGQRWTTLSELRTAGHRGTVTELEPELFGISIEPAVGIGQRALIARTAEGNLLWDPPGYLDDELVAAVEAMGGITAVATSHPHMFGAQVSWSQHFGGVPVYVNRADQDWIQRDDPVITRWDDRLDVLPGIELHRIGGHFPGSAVARIPTDDGAGALLCGDTVLITPDQHWVTFLRSYPNAIPLSADVVGEVADRLLGLAFDRLYDDFGGVVAEDAAGWVRRSADRYRAWARGDHDRLTRVEE